MQSKKKKKKKKLTHRLTNSEVSDSKIRNGKSLILQTKMYKYNIFLKKILHKSCDFLPQYIMDGYPTPMADFKVNKLGQLFTCPSTPLITILCAIIMSGIKRRSSAISPKLKMVENTDRRKTFSNTMPTYITHCSM